MAEQPRLRIRGNLYAYPTSSKLGDAALIEQLTGLTHAEWRKRYVASITDALAADEEEQVEEDSSVTIGIIAIAVARENPKWSRAKVVEFVNDLDFDEVVVEGGDVSPPESEATDQDPTSPNGTKHVETSRSDSDLDLRKSTTPPTSGRSTSLT